MSDKKIVSISTLKEGSYIILDGIACRISSMDISRPGKHGHAKVNLFAVGLIDGKKRNAVMPGHENVEVPIIEKKTAQVLNINGNKANVMDIESFETFDLEIPDELKAECVEGCQVLYWDIIGDRVMKQVKVEGA
jgi:translation initiation factor 5A